MVCVPFGVHVEMHSDPSLYLWINGNSVFTGKLQLKGLKILSSEKKRFTFRKHIKHNVFRRMWKLFSASDQYCFLFNSFNFEDAQLPPCCL